MKITTLFFIVGLIVVLSGCNPNGVSTIVLPDSEEEFYLGIKCLAKHDDWYNCIVNLDNDNYYFHKDEFIDEDGDDIVCTIECYYDESGLLVIDVMFEWPHYYRTDIVYINMENYGGYTNLPMEHTFPDDLGSVCQFGIRISKTKYWE